MSLSTRFSPKAFYYLLLTLSLLTPASFTRELYVGEISAANNFVFTTLDVRQTFECRNLLINTMSADTLTASQLTMDQIFAEEIINSESAYIILQGSLNIRGSMAWNPQPSPPVPDIPPTSTNTTTEPTEGTAPTQPTETIGAPQATDITGTTGPAPAGTTEPPTEGGPTDTQAAGIPAPPPESTEAGAPSQSTESAPNPESPSAPPVESTETQNPAGPPGSTEAPAGPEGTEATGATEAPPSGPPTEGPAPPSGPVEGPPPPQSPESGEPQPIPATPANPYPVESTASTEGTEGGEGQETTGGNAGEGTPAVSFLKVDSLILNGVKQWTMIDHEHFDDAGLSLLQVKDVNGWRVKGSEESNFEAMVTPKLGSIYDSNPDDKALLTKHSNVIFKEFRKLPSHDSLMVEAQLLLHAPMWKGEAVFAKVNNRVIWLEHYDSGEVNDNCEMNEESWQRTPISFNLQHKEDSVLIEFGTNMPESGLKSCENLNMKDTVGLDDFVMYAK